MRNGAVGNGGLRLVLRRRRLQPLDQGFVLQHFVEVDLEQRHPRPFHERAAGAHQGPFGFDRQQDMRTTQERLDHRDLRRRAFRAQRVEKVRLRDVDVQDGAPARIVREREGDRFAVRFEPLGVDRHAGGRRWLRRDAKLRHIAERVGCLATLSRRRADGRGRHVRHSRSDGGGERARLRFR